MKRVMTIAGSDSGGGAGIEADLKTFAVLGVYGTVALTAVTAQNTVAVRRVHYLPSDLVRDQMECVLEDIGIDAAKTGMLGEEPVVEAVSSVLSRARVPHLVVDPAMIAKNDACLLVPEAVACLKDRLLPLATVVTPNVPELACLTGRTIADEQGLKDAAVALWDQTGVKYVLAKGGHLVSRLSTDWLYDGKEFLSYTGPRLPTRHTHGTGCTMSAALAAYLACGLEVKEAVGRAKVFLNTALAAAMPLGRGWGPINPLACLPSGPEGGA